MAEDAIALLDYVGWTGHRDLHVVGISLGGMIAQGKPEVISVTYVKINSRDASELATRIPERIASLTLGVTTPGGHPWTNFPPVALQYQLIVKYAEISFSGKGYLR